MAGSGKQGSAIYLSHGGGPLPILGDAQHAEMVRFMKEFARSRRRPDSIIVVSAHWEERVPSIISSANPPLRYDYYGFPREAYSLSYPLPGNPSLAGAIRDSFAAAGIESELETSRGFDHGVFIPLMLMYPESPIPTVQISLIAGLDPARHIHMGKALKPLLSENVLIVGSGFSFHNMNAFFSDGDGIDERNDLFQNRLVEACTRSASIEAAEKDLIEWERFPGARYCHPREEHLLPLHACFGAAGSPERAGKIVFDDRILGKRSIAVLWE